MIIFLSDKKKKEKKVFFLSLAAFEKTSGRPSKELSLFDVFTEVELEEYEIEFMSCQDLEEYYHEWEGDKTRSPDIYELAKYVMTKNPGSHFFLDEVPFLPDSYGM